MQHGFIIMITVYLLMMQQTKQVDKQYFNQALLVLLPVKAAY